MVFQNNILAGVGGQGGDAVAYDIPYSCLFNDDDSPKLEHTTGGTPTDASKGVFGTWFKRSNLAGATAGTNATLVSGVSERQWLYMDPTDQIYVVDDAYAVLESSQVLRDSTAWYHIIMSYDSDQAAGADRLLIYLNGRAITVWDTDARDTRITSGEAWGLTVDAEVKTVGALSTSNYWDGYLAQTFLVDGLSIQNGDFSIGSFGEYNNNVWRPVDVTGLSFGTNGWLLDYADSSDLGKDISGNSNDFTSTNLATTDQVTDTPTNNFATYNPLNIINSGATFENGKLVHNKATTGYAGAVATMPVPTTGKWAFKIKITGSVSGSNDGILGLFADISGNFYNDGAIQGVASYYNFVGIAAYSDGGFRYQFDDGGSTEHFNGPACVTDDEFEFLVDRDGGTVDIVKNGSAYGTQLTGLPSDTQMWPGSVNYATNTTATFNYTPSDTDYKTLCTDNLAEPTIKNSKKYYDNILYEGTGFSQKAGQFQPMTESYTVGNSALFIDDDSCYLSRTPSLVGNRTTMTFSFWFKKGNNGIQELLQSVTGLSNYISFNTTNTFQLNTSGSGELRTTRTFEDSTQWYHFLVAIDTTQSTAADRLKIYVNGVQETDFGSETYPAQMTEMTWNTATGHFVGQSGSTSLFVDGYMAETHFIDGQGLTSSTFGEVDSTTNRWIPKEYSYSTTTPAISFVSDDSTGVNATTFTFSSQALGAAATDRRIVVAVGAGGGSTGTASGVTVGGVTATQVVQSALDVEAISSIWWAAVPTGTTGDVVVTFTSSKGNCGVSCYRLTGADVVLGAALQSAAGSGAASSGTVGTPNNAVVVGNTYHEEGSGSGRTTTWSGLTENVDDEIEGGSTFSTASGLITAASVTATATPSGSTANEVFTLASFGSSAYGVNGYYLDFADKNDLGDDESGNTNDFAESGFDTTNGSNQFYDTPTRNFATMSYGRSINETLTDGNLLATSGGATGQVRTPTAFGLTSGKWYFEFLMVGGSTNERTMYVVQDDVAITATQIRSTTGHYSGYYSFDGDAMTPGDVTSTTGEGEDYGDTYTAADVISCALDLDIGAIWWGKNGTWQNSATEAEIEAGNTSKAAQTGMSNIGSVKAGAGWFPTMQNNTTQASHANFGQHIYFDSTTLTLDTSAGGYFRHGVPDGFKAIHVDNLTESDSFQSAFCWIKNRDATDNFMNFDRVRGPFSFWHSNDDADISSDPDTLTRFLKQGATLGDDVRVNTANETYSFWDWFIETTGSGTSNEDGSINTASTLVDTNCGFSISKFEGTGANATVGHGLGIAPKFVILKHFDNSNYSTTVGHGALPVPTLEYLILDTTDAKQSNAAIWNSTIPTSSVVSLGSSAASNNSGTDYMMYCFAEIEGFSRFGTYEGNGDTDGTCVYTGFLPAFLMLKSVDSSSSWTIYDTLTQPYNGGSISHVIANATNVQQVQVDLDLLSNGFKLRVSGDPNVAETWVYVAFAYNPFGGDSTTPGTAY